MKRTTTDEANRAALLAALHRDSGAWLNALPAPNLRTFLRDEEVRIGIALRFGLPVVEEHNCVNCGSHVETNGHHGLSCSSSRGRWPRHVELSDVTKRALEHAGYPCQSEPLGLSGINNTRPDDMTLVPVRDGKALVWDATGWDIVALSHVRACASASGSVALLAEDRKRHKYVFVEEMGYLLYPLAVETFGTFGPAFAELIRFVSRYAGQARMLDESSTECHVGRIPSSLWITRQSFQYARYAAQKFWEIHLSYQSSGQQRPQRLTSPSLFVGSYRDNAQPSGVNFKFDTVLTVDNHLGSYKAYLEDPIVCSASERAKLCTTSALELERCGLMKPAFQAHRIRPELECQPPVKNPYICLTKINANQTDIAMVDVGDLAGSHFNAIQLAQERFVSRDRLGSSSSIFDEAYSVALVRDPNIRSLNDLRGKHACFSGVFEANGFMLPINALRRNGLLGHSDCQNIRAAADFFGDSCLPCLSDAELNTNVWTDDKAKLCRRCQRGEQSCARGGDNKYDGEMGALNCLRDGKGDVAFVSHTVLNEIPDEQRRMFCLVCGQANSGTAQGIDSYSTCSLAKAQGALLVFHYSLHCFRYKPLAEKRRLTDMLLTASSLFSADLTINNFQNVRIDLPSGAMDRARKTYHMFGKRNRNDSYLTYSSSSSFYGQTGRTGGSQYNSGNNQYNNQYQSNQYQQSTSSYYNSNNNYQQQQNQQQQSQYSNQPLSTLNTAGHYAIFSPSAYDLRGFGDDNTTHVGLALGSYRELAERSNWRVCIDTGTAGRPAVAGMFSVLVMVVLSRILLFEWSTVGV
ncbi:LOW QUALITY PROTEIN: uncharacterized protein LOC129599546 [Paramacrobiotus metropolitanus]|uniref:LOW QUALITY PROTEIN: uncharacterized protein LOC129599546 n=1 Tax=Paramacrobiotus metropolitanus TaxID=2943436 RepID=UPI002445636C|nr:LOW QUALITY PROTEIN: uncharacterized protein LOC129599546 [Paramacrobiotus metropolitanus]